MFQIWNTSNSKCLALNSEQLFQTWNSPFQSSWKCFELEIALETFPQLSKQPASNLKQLFQTWTRLFQNCSYSKFKTFCPTLFKMLLPLFWHWTLEGNARNIHYDPYVFEIMQNPAAKKPMGTLSLSTPNASHQIWPAFTYTHVQPSFFSPNTLVNYACSLGFWRVHWNCAAIKFK